MKLKFSDINKEPLLSDFEGIKELKIGSTSIVAGRGKTMNSEISIKESVFTMCIQPFCINEGLNKIQ